MSEPLTGKNLKNFKELAVQSSPNSETVRDQEREELQKRIEGR